LGISFEDLRIVEKLHLHRLIGKLLPFLSSITSFQDEKGFRSGIGIPRSNRFIDLVHKLANPLGVFLQDLVGIAGPNGEGNRKKKNGKKKNNLFHALHGKRFRKE
jgi:hypothetical protein